ncbi:MAG: pyridoxal phosphate-dependent aminotransferase [Planctomycetes bacterium]|nr:pyridoxal phosphate-dependent aminotransferase [Planctomycetota bacterium]
MILSHRISALTESVTLGISAKAKQMQADGINIIDFSVGEPDFDTPDIVKQSAIEALNKGFTKYTPTSGIPALKKAIIEKLKADNDLTYLPSEIIVSAGAKHAIFNAIQAICNPKDEVLVPTPYWVSYPEQIKVSEAKCVFVPTYEANGFRLKAKDVAAKVTRRTKVIIINSPNNPTGAVIEPKELKAIAELAVKKNFFVISDEIYEKLIYGNAKHVSIASFNNKIKDLTVVINGVSKSYAMTGWRIGFAAGPAYLISLMAQMQGHITSNPTSIAQYAAVTAYQKGEPFVRKMKQEFAKRCSYLYKALNAMPHLKCHQPEGAFYAFPNVSKLFGKTYEGNTIPDSVKLCELLLTRAHIAVVPGDAFGSNRNIRFSYANSMPNLAEGMKRLQKFLKSVR